MSSTDTTARDILHKALAETQIIRDHTSGRVVDAFLAALADEGFRLAGPGEVVVDARIFERVRHLAFVDYNEHWSDFTTQEHADAIAAIQPGDLDPIAAPDAGDGEDGMIMFWTAEGDDAPDFVPDPWADGREG